MKREDRDITKYNQNRIKKGESDNNEYNDEEITSAKFKKLEIKVREFEKLVLEGIKVDLVKGLNNKVGLQSRGVDLCMPVINLQKNPFRNKEQEQFIDLLVEIFLKYLNNNVVFINTLKIRSLIKEGKRDSPIIIACCSISFPFSTNLTFGKCLLFEDNHFYFQLKRIAEDLSSKDYLFNSFLFHLCYLTEFNQGYNDIAFKSCVKGIKLMHASGLVDEIDSETLLKNKDDFTLDRGLLWNYWIDCELIGVKDHERYILHKPIHLNLISSLIGLKFFTDGNKPVENEVKKLKLLYIYNFETFRFISSLQFTIAKGIIISDQVVQQSHQVYSSMYKMHLRNRSWFQKIKARMDSPLLKHPLFYQITPQLLLNIAQIFLFTQSLSYAEKAYSLDFRVSKEYPSIKEIAFELLGILDDLKQFSKIKEPHIPPGAFLYTSVIYAISFYYGCSVFVRDYTPEGSLLFLRALEVLRTISNYYGTVDYWILMLLKERKDNQSYYSPPLSNKN